MIAGVNIAGYDGSYPVIIPKASKTFNPATMFEYKAITKGMAAATNGYVYNTTVLAELQALCDLRYGGASPGNLASFPAFRASAGGTSSVGTWFSWMTASGLDSIAADPTYLTQPVAVDVNGGCADHHDQGGPGGRLVVPVSQITSSLPAMTPAAFPWALQIGTAVTVNDAVAANVETVPRRRRSIIPPAHSRPCSRRSMPPARRSPSVRCRRWASRPFRQAGATLRRPWNWRTIRSRSISTCPASDDRPALDVASGGAGRRLERDRRPSLTSCIFRLMPTTFGPTYSGMAAAATW